MYGINKSIVELVRNDYAEHLSEASYEIDCSLGQNPYGFNPDVKLTLEDFAGIDEYPHGDDVIKDAIIKRYQEIANLEASQISISCGSMGILMTLNRLFLHPGKTVIGVAPQFTAIVDDMHVYEASYEPVFLKKENNFKFDVKEFIEAVKNKPNAYIYIDNPNNPTGQVIPLEELEAIVVEAQKQNSFVCIDEAYGDYMDDDNSAIGILDKYDNLCVSRTFSKGLGMAGMRVGYVMSNKEFIKYFDKVTTPFAISGASGKIASKVINSNWQEFAKSRAKEIKPMINANLKNIKISYTTDSVPIALYYVEDENINLDDVFVKNGMRVVTCAGYDGLAQNYVRINMHKDEDKFVELLYKTDASI